MLEREGLETGMEKAGRVKIEGAIVNAYMQLTAAKAAGLEGPFILIHYLSDLGRGGIGQYWVVDRPGFVLDKQAHWSMRGKKAFDLHGGEESFAQRKAGALEAAKTWVNERYGEVAWAKNGAGDYLPAHINAAFPIKRSK